jgi:hypothetical protein
MRYLLLTLLLSCGLHLASAQAVTDHRTVIREKLETYYQANKDKDYDTVLDMVYPKLFTLHTQKNLLHGFPGYEGE